MRDLDVQERINAAFRRMDALYIADGHHQSAAAHRLQDIRTKRGDAAPETSRFLAVMFAEDELNVMAYNRVVADLNGPTEQEFLQELGNVFELEPKDSAVAPSMAHEFGIYLKGQWWKARVRAGLVDESDAKARLDVSVLQDQVLEPMLGISDPRTNSRIPSLDQGCSPDQVWLRAVVAMERHEAKASDTPVNLGIPSYR